MQISIVNGVLADAGIGVVINGKVRISTENTKVLFRETQIGLFPALGMSFSLLNLKDMGPAIGLYLVMTGIVLDGKKAT